MVKPRPCKSMHELIVRVARKCNHTPSKQVIPSPCEPPPHFSLKQKRLPLEAFSLLRLRLRSSFPPYLPPLCACLLLPPLLIPYLNCYKIVLRCCVRALVFPALLSLSLTHTNTHTNTHKHTHTYTHTQNRNYRQQQKRGWRVQQQF